MTPAFHGWVRLSGVMVKKGIFESTTFKQLWEMYRGMPNCCKAGENVMSISLFGTNFGLRPLNLYWQGLQIAFHYPQILSLNLLPLIWQVMWVLQSKSFVWCWLSTCSIPWYAKSFKFCLQCFFSVPPSALFIPQHLWPFVKRIARRCAANFRSC